MHPFIEPRVLLFPLFITSILASESRVWTRSSGASGLQDRQSQAFQPGTTFGQGATCEAAFGAGYISCGAATKCYNPSIGDSCCQPSDPYACPSGSFCLIDDYCCPNGLDAASCALQNSVTLPPDFSTNAIPVAAATSVPAATSAAAVSSSAPVSSAAAVSSSAPVSSAAAVSSSSSSTATSVPTLYGNATSSFQPYTPTTTIPFTPYTGAANIEGRGAVMAAVGIFGAAVALL